MKITRLFINICTDDLGACKAFYTELFAFELVFDSNWFVQLRARETGLELGLIDRQHPVTPKEARGEAGGGYLTLVVDEVESIYREALEKGQPILAPPADTAYGQRRLLLQDPAGTVLDVSAPIPNFKFEG